MKAYLVLFAAIAFAISPFLSPEFGGFDPERYPIPQNDPAVQPAGWAFAIWGLIYLALIMHAGLGVFRHKDDADWNRGRIALFISLAVGAIWLPVALLSPIWATVLIWVMLIAVLISLYQTQSAQPAWSASWPVALYAGWLSAASFVSIGLLLAGYGLTSEGTAAIIALVLAVAFAVYHFHKLGHWSYSAAIAWGFLGIAFANAGTNTLVAVLSGLAVVLMLAMIGYRWRVSGGVTGQGTS